jgi:hypothetical protein
MIGSTKEGGKNFVSAEYITYKEIFPKTYLFKVKNEIPDKNIQNIMLVAFKTQNKDPLLNITAKAKKILADRLPLVLASKEAVLTDDFAPVEKYNTLMLR